MATVEVHRGRDAIVVVLLSREWWMEIVAEKMRFALMGTARVQGHIKGRDPSVMMVPAVHYSIHPSPHPFSYFKLMPNYKRCIR